MSGLDPITDDLADDARLRANEDSVAAYYAALAAAPGAEADDRPGRLRVATMIDHPFFNGVLRTRLPPADLDPYLDATIAFFAPKGVRWAWWAWPTSEPKDLGDRLAARGFAPRATMPLMSWDLRAVPDEPPPDGLRIERVADARMLATWTDVAGIAFRLAPEKRPRYVDVYASLGFAPDGPFQSFTGSVDGVPVAVSTSFLGAGVVGVYGVATLPEHRGRGYGRALSLAALRDGRARGYRWAVLQSSEMGLPVYKRLGFSVDGEVRLHALPPPAR